MTCYGLRLRRVTARVKALAILRRWSTESLVELQARLDREDVVLLWETREAFGLDAGPRTEAVHATIGEALIALRATCGVVELVVRDETGHWRVEADPAAAFARERQGPAAEPWVGGDWPAWMTPAPSFCLDALEKEVVRATRAAWLAHRARAPAERPYGFGIYVVAEDGMSLMDAFCTEEGLDRLASSPSSVAPGTSSVTERRRLFRWWEADWPETGRAVDEYAAANEMLFELRGAVRAHLDHRLERGEWERRLVRDVGPFDRRMRATYAAALATLDQEALFGSGDARLALVLGLFGPDEEGLLSSVAQLNPRAVAERFARERSGG
ncbi:MAG: DUF4303 domain-containing protein [Sandaracinus sp.]